jgi:uncharacterized protein (DUF4415 family)
MSDNVTRVSSEELDELDDRTDWERLEKMCDEDIEEAVAEDEDQELLPAEWFQAATLVDPAAGKKRITIRLDEDVIDFFKGQGEGYQTRINKVLRAYVLMRKLRDLLSEETEHRDLQPFLDMIMATKAPGADPTSSSGRDLSAISNAISELSPESPGERSAEENPAET